MTIQAGKTATFTLTFTPQSSGSATASVSFTTDASNTPVVNALNGSGAAAPQHSVQLSWTASKSAVAGYNVYRAAKTGGPYSKLNGSLDTGTSFTDNSVSAGQTYFYVTTAVDSSGGESTFSNEAQAAVPTP
jgi:fibronectin type 3 domain-containing protein